MRCWLRSSRSCAVGSVPERSSGESQGLRGLPNSWAGVGRRRRSQEPRFAGAWGLREHIRIRRGWQLICRRTCSNVTPCLGALAQLVARLGRIEKVTGSTPVCSTTMMEGRPVRSLLLSSLCQQGAAPCHREALASRCRALHSLPNGTT